MWIPPYSPLGVSSQVLLYTNIDVTTYQVCVDTHPNGWVEPGMLCAGRPDDGWDRDACQVREGDREYCNLTCVC